MSDELHFLFGIHNHQPVGNFESVVDDAVRQAYHPFLQTVADVGGDLRLTVHCSGGLLDALKARARPTFDLLGRLASDGRVELLGGGFYEPILALLPDWDKIGQIQALGEFIRAHFGAGGTGGYFVADYHFHQDGHAFAAERYGVPVAAPHEALDDALVTAQLFLVLASKLEAKGLGSTKRLLRLTRV